MNLNLSKFKPITCLVLTVLLANVFWNRDSNAATSITRHLMSVLKISENAEIQIQAIKTSTLQQVKRTAPSKLSIINTKLDRELKRDRILNAVGDAIEGKYTQDEIKKLAEFYGSPLGKKASHIVIELNGLFSAAVSAEIEKIPEIIELNKSLGRKSR